MIRLPCLRMLVLAAAFGLGPAPEVFAADRTPVAAAADLKFALDAVVAQFKADTGRELSITYGSSGNFARQLQQDAPFEVFLSADEGFVFKLADAGKTLDRGILYAEGRIVLFVPHGSPLKADDSFTDLKTAIADGRVQKFAIANPEHAPYGVAAEQALATQGLWTVVQPRLVLGENVAQAAQFAATGSTQGGIFAYSLALSPEIGKLGTFALIPAAWHQPLRQRMVLMKNAGDTARALYDYLQTSPARTVLRKFGFVLPGETP